MKELIPGGIEAIFLTGIPEIDNHPELTIRREKILHSCWPHGLAVMAFAKERYLGVEHVKITQAFHNGV